MFCHRQTLPSKEIIPLNKEIHPTGEVVIPNLTHMVKDCEDLDLRPMTHIDRVYPFSYHYPRVLLPEIRTGDLSSRTS